MNSLTLKGQSMFEVLVALFIIILIIVGVITASTSSISNSIFARNQTLASKYSQEAIEWLRSQSQINPKSFNTYANTTTYCLDALSWANTGTCATGETIANEIFRRQVNFTKSVVSLKNVIQADVITYWNDSKGYHEAKSTTNFTDIRQK